MTSEQVEDFFLQLDHLHPSEEKEVMRDPDFEREQAEMEEANRGVLWDDAVVVPHGTPVASPTPQPEEEWEELTEWDYRQLAKRMKDPG